MILFLRNWHLLPDSEKSRLCSWFDCLYPEGWNYRRFVGSGPSGLENPVDMKIEFNDTDLALLFKLTWGGVVS